MESRLSSGPGPRHLTLPLRSSISLPTQLCKDLGRRCLLLHLTPNPALVRTWATLPAPPSHSQPGGKDLGRRCLLLHLTPNPAVKDLGRRCLLLHLTPNPAVRTWADAACSSISLPTRR
ncbi:unnamed protein product [Boreogadus saida]